MIVRIASGARAESKAPGAGSETKRQLAIDGNSVHSQIQRSIDIHPNQHIDEVPGPENIEDIHAPDCFGGSHCDAAYFSIDSRGFAASVIEGVERDSYAGASSFFSDRAVGKIIREIKAAAVSVLLG